MSNPSVNFAEIAPVTRPFRKTVLVPGSKSITNRALVLAALAERSSALSGVLFADDTWQMIRALQALGLDVQADEAARTVRVTGRGTQWPNANATLVCGNSGTTIRFLAAMLSTGVGQYVLDGVERMRQRPIDELVAQLRALGAKISYVGSDGFPPLQIAAAALAGGTCRFENAKSSQYISAILLAGPYAKAGVTVELAGPVTSEPYVAMTLRMMEQWGVKSSERSVIMPSGAPAPLGMPPGAIPARTIIIPAGKYAPRAYAVEPDASNASYFLAAAAIVKEASITIENLGKGSLQGDVAFADVLHQMGAGLAFGRDFITVTGTGELHGIEIDMNAIPDMVQTLAVVALFADSPTTIRNVWNLRVKETDRLAALETELAKLGVKVETGRDWIAISPPTMITPASIATYDDHRMAMAFAVAGLRVAGVRIEDPGCTAKTYPGYFADLAAAVG